MNFKEALRKDTNYLRGLGSLDAQLRQNWINQNAARLGKLKMFLLLMIIKHLQRIYIVCKCGIILRLKI